MRVVDAIARILKIEGAEFLSAYPTTSLIDAAAKADIRSVLCRQERVGARNIGGRYADLGRAMGGWSERVERPEDIAGAFARARKATESGQAALLEFITSQETRFSNRGALR